jgi:hypothetical protein
MTTERRLQRKCNVKVRTDSQYGTMDETWKYGISNFRPDSSLTSVRSQNFKIYTE